MKRFMKFSDIVELITTGYIQPGLMIKCVATDQTLVLNQFTLSGSTQTVLAFSEEDRTIPQTIDVNSVWELVNIPLEGDVTNEIIQ